MPLMHDKPTALAILFAIVPLGVFGQGIFTSAIDLCPASCDTRGPSPSNWTLYPDFSQLKACTEPLVFELGLYNELYDPAVNHAVHACSTSGMASDTATIGRRQGINATIQSNTTSLSAPTGICGTASAQTVSSKVDLTVSHSGITNDSPSSKIKAAVRELAKVATKAENCENTVLFSQVNGAVAGIYSGSQIDAKSLVPMFGKIATHLDTQPSTGGFVLQLCGPKSTNSDIIGIYADASGDLARTQAVLRDWNEARCASEDGNSIVWTDETVGLLPARFSDASNILGRSIHRRADREDHKVVPGDYCDSIATKYGITVAQLVSYNGGDQDKFCGGLQEDQWVCYTSGTLPDRRPQPNSDGSCKSYQLQSGDFCDTIAKANSMTTQDIEDRNRNTWGWAGCRNLQPRQIFCLSEGTPPMPHQEQDYVCGPQVVGTEKPDNGTEMRDLNPCALNACCNVWGQCGITNDFCVEAPADTGAPGTAQPNTDGCIASCGNEILNNDFPPSQFIRVGYFEAWNRNRPCLHMDVSQMANGYYTHVHWGFADITPDYRVDVSRYPEEFEGLLKLAGVKRIVSFGGWDFSTMPETAPIFRKGVTAEERKRFADNVIEFVKTQGLDGVDFDWEYPGAPDMPGIPPGDEDDGIRYMEFLEIVRDGLRTEDGFSVSIATPASMWYLKGFPIKEMMEFLDYTIYMTYDLHGQWDYGNKYVNPGCSDGNCIRHHCNQTETELALAIITKAGVPSNKVIVGMALYGRSFKMAEVGCYGPLCKFTGSFDTSNAAGGKCTGTAGYISNWEINQIIEGVDADTYEMIKDGEGDILVYNGDEYVSWLTPKSYASRVSWVQGLNFGGTSDWAADLADDYGDTVVGQAEYVRDPDAAVFENQYVVAFHEGHSIELHQSAIGLDPTQFEDYYSSKHSSGYVAKFDKQTRDQLIRSDPGVRLVQADYASWFDDEVIEGGDGVAERSTNESGIYKREYEWLERYPSTYNLIMSSHTGELATPVREQGYYTYHRKGGEGVDVYIMDTGINQHNTMSDRSYDFLGKSYCDYSVRDHTGHGTHVAGIVGSKAYGIAESVTLWNVKAVCSELREIEDGRQVYIPHGQSNLKISDAIIDITMQHRSRKRGEAGSNWRGSIINMSFGGRGRSPFVDEAIREAWKEGIVIVAAAGNNNGRASKIFPCNYKTVICIGAINNEYKKHWLSNYGERIDFLAPGAGIKSASWLGGDAWQTISGTSQATPHVSGIAAIFIWWEALFSDAQLVWQRINDQVVENVGGGGAGWPSGTKQRLATNGINHPSKPEWAPYSGAPRYSASGLKDPGERWCRGHKINSGSLRKYEFRLDGVDTDEFCGGFSNEWHSCLYDDNCAPSSGGLNCGEDREDFVHGGKNVGLGCSPTTVQNCIRKAFPHPDPQIECSNDN